MKVRKMFFDTTFSYNFIEKIFFKNMFLLAVIVWKKNVIDSGRGHGYKGPFLQSWLTTLPINSEDCPWVFL